LWVLSTTICLVVATGLVADATSPQPTPPDPFEIYEWREDLGGWLDTTRNLVWGYDSGGILGYGLTYSLAQNFVQNYAATMASTAIQRQSQADESYARAAYLYSIGELEGALWHEQQGDLYASIAAGLAAAAPIASQYTNWRIPSLEEALDAVNKGLFTYSNDQYDDADFDGYNSVPQVPPSGLSYGNIPAWSNDVGGNKNKIKGRDTAWVYLPITGEPGVITQTSQIPAIVVRTHLP
jgi:hypothetical protein